MRLPRTVKLVEVGPRDGLQSEAVVLSPEQRLHLVKRLAACGFEYIEAGSFVSDKWIPQLAQSDTVLKRLRRSKQAHYSALVPNLVGLERALVVGVKEVAIFVACTESFSQKNLNCSIDQSIKNYQAVIEKALAQGVRVRAYLSCVFGCPYEGEVSMTRVKRLAAKLYQLGCYEISLGDTIGMGTISSTRKLIGVLESHLPTKVLALHFHDTRGQALANIYAALQLGIQVFDCSVGGLGGCPYAKSPTGNVASEDLIYMLHSLNIKTGVNLDKLIRVNHMLCEILQKPLNARIARIKARKQ